LPEAVLHSTLLHVIVSVAERARHHPASPSD
jgi:hypothetical protein